MINTYNFESGNKGVRLAITGAVHGNEVCGAIAIQALIDKLNSGEIKLCSGSLLLIPIANPEAYKKGVRFIDENLNRVFTKFDKPESYEQKIANELTAAVSGCDVLLDLHSIHTKGWPFIMHFGLFSDDEERFLNSLDVPYIVEGWAEAYERSFPSGKGANVHTVSFMHSIGKMAVGVECGLHNDISAVETASRTINKALEHFGLIEKIGDIRHEKAQHVLMKKVYVRESMEDIFTQDFAHGSEVKKGDVIVIKKSGEKIVAEDDCLVLFPRPNCPLNEEFFYTGVYKYQ